eukprot:s1775_g5.t1
MAMVAGFRDGARDSTDSVSCEFRPQCVANSAWSFVTLSESSQALWDALAQRAEHVFEGKQEPQHLANTL